MGKRLIAPMVPAFKEAYPLITIRLRLSDRKLDLAGEGLDAAFFLGVPEDSTLRIRKIADCPRVLCAAPDYIARKGLPRVSADLRGDTHDCLNLRFPGAPEFQWPLQTPEGIKRLAVSGPFETDDGDVLTNWALDGHGIILKPLFEVAEYLSAGRLVPVLEGEPPIPIQMACLYTHRRHQDPKTRLFIDFVVNHIQASLPQGA
ncbi:MAG: substrate binding domain-containing protein, partial [Roseovarius sp.]|jgi:LysR family transcriptional activator of dmlA|nr:substrate binding domain-containing protein [Roseovarius sp.]